MFKGSYGEFMSETEQTKAMKEHSEPSKEETKTDNELIAEFMGLKSRMVGTYQPIEVWYKDDPDKWFSFPDYNTWNSLYYRHEK